MIKIQEVAGLPFIEVNVHFRGKSMKLPYVLIDTGSAGTIFNVNQLEKIGVKPESKDETRTIRGVGGVEFVYTKRLDRIALSEEIAISHFLVELGSMEYGLELDGIVGYDFMKELGCLIDLKRMTLSIE